MQLSGGGYILLGFNEDGGTWKPGPNRPASLSGYSQDFVNSVVHKYAEPSFHCEVYHTPHPQSGQPFPVIIVPGGHKVPIRAKRDGPNRNHVKQYAYYILRPGPTSEEPRTGTEWDDLIARCVLAAKDELLESFRTILFGLETTGEATRGVANELDEWTKSARSRFEKLVKAELSSIDPQRYTNGIWTVAYIISGDTNPTSPGEFLDILRRIQGHESGWPVWWVPALEELSPYPYEGLIECWLAKGTLFVDPAHSDFWRASPEGKMYLLQGYQEDSEPDRIPPGKIFDLTIPVWRVGECLLHAERLASEIAGDTSTITFRFTWEGLTNRTLYPWAAPERIMFDSRKSRQGIVTSGATLTPEEIRSNLPEAVFEITQPLYGLFDFFIPPKSMIEDELAKMRGRRL